MIVEAKMRNSAAAVLGVIIFVGGPAGAAGPWRADEGNTRGWQLMSPQERIEHQARVRGFTDYQACQAYRAQHHQEMVERATKRGLSLPTSGRDICDHLKPQLAPD
jgi:hypothetical protein